MDKYIEFLQGYFSNYDFGLMIFGNTVGEYVIALTLFIGLAIIFKIVQWTALQRLAKLAEKTETDIDDTLIRIVKSLKPGFYLFLAFFFLPHKHLSLLQWGRRY